jgi:hypothetical protein
VCFRSLLEKGREQLMPSYHCYFLDNEHHIRSTEVIETALLKDAIDLSLSMLKKRQHYKVEVWEGATQRYSRTRPARKSSKQPKQARNELDAAGSTSAAE